MDERWRDLGPEPAARTPSPYPLSELQADIDRSSLGLRTGFPGLDRLVAIPRSAITLVAGRPSHGKTAVLLNLMVSMSRVYQDQTFVLLSYEEPRRQLGLKLLNILSGTLMNPDQPSRNLREIEEYLRRGRSDNAALEHGKDDYAELLGSGRILLDDDPLPVDDWGETIAALSAQRPVGAVLVDSIHKVMIRGEFPSRHAELRRISERILETAKNLRLPVILTAQMSRDPTSLEKVRLENLREAEEIEHDANLVLGLHNDAIERAQERGERPKGPVVDLKVTVLKNRNGMINQYAFLTFNRPVMTVVDAQDGSPW